MSDWGIPYWLNASAYGDTKRWSGYRWRWEFTRRREDCRADFLAHKDETVRFYEECRAFDIKQKPNALLAKMLRPDEPGFVAQVPGCREKYGLSSLPNPAIGDQPFYVIIFATRYPKFGGWSEWVTTPQFKETEAVVIVDLTKPIHQQLDAARPFLEYKQKKRIGHVVVSGRKHYTKWLMYLRVLDARESGASLSQIAASGLLEPTHGHVGAQSARDVLRQAQSVSLNWPSVI